MRPEEIEIEEGVIEKISENEEYETLLGCVEEDFSSAEVENPRAYDSQNDSVENTVVFPLSGIPKCTFGSMAFGLEDGVVTKASLTLHFNEDKEDKRSKVRDYRYLHDDEKFYRPKDDMVIENEEREDGVVEVIEYYQDND